MVTEERFEELIRITARRFAEERQRLRLDAEKMRKEIDQHKRDIDALRIQIDTLERAAPPRLVGGRREARHG